MKFICILVSSLLNYIDWMDLTQRHSFCKDTEDGFIFKNPWNPWNPWDWKIFSWIFGDSILDTDVCNFKFVFQHNFLSMMFMKMNCNKFKRLKPFSLYMTFSNWRWLTCRLWIFEKNDILKLLICVQLCINFNVNDLSI